MRFSFSRQVSYETEFQGYGAQKIHVTEKICKKRVWPLADESVQQVLFETEKWFFSATWKDFISSSQGKDLNMSLFRCDYFLTQQEPHKLDQRCQKEQHWGVLRASLLEAHVWMALAVEETPPLAGATGPSMMPRAPVPSDWHARFVQFERLKQQTLVIQSVPLVWGWLPSPTALHL